MTFKKAALSILSAGLFGLCMQSANASPFAALADIEGSNAAFTTTNPHSGSVNDGGFDAFDVAADDGGEAGGRQAEVREHGALGHDADFRLGVAHRGLDLVHAGDVAHGGLDGQGGGVEHVEIFADEVLVDLERLAAHPAGDGGGNQAVGFVAQEGADFGEAVLEFPVALELGFEEQLDLAHVDAFAGLAAHGFGLAGGGQDVLEVGEGRKAFLDFLDAPNGLLEVAVGRQLDADEDPRLVGGFEEAEAEASDAHSRPAGQLKVHTMTGIGHHFVIDAIARYRKTHPDVTFDLTLANRVPDLLNEGYDISIVLATELPDSGFVSQRLGITYSIVCASPDYVKANGKALKPSDLLNHACLRLVSPVIALDKWVFEGPEGQEMVLINSSPFLVNSADAMRNAIISGMGVGVLPLYSAIEGLRNGTLVRILPQYRSQELNLYAIYPSRQYLDAKIKTWVEFLRGTLPDILTAHQVELATYS